MTKILVFDKGGRKERINLIKKNKAPKDFFQSINFLKSKGFDIENLSSSIKYKDSFLINIGKFIEEIFSKISNIGIRPLAVFQFREKIKKTNYVVSLTDGFSLSLGFYYYFFDKNNKIKLAGGFHRLSDYNTKLPTLLKGFYFRIFKKILGRLNYLIFYGEADRVNSIKHFNLDKEKTHTIKFGVDTLFWKPNNKNNFNSKYIFSIGQDPARDFNTLLKITTKKKIHIHTNLLKEGERQNIKITNGSYNNLKNSYTDLEIRKLYQNAFAVVVPLKNVYQPSGYSVTLQAMACGKPVILTLTKGLWAPKFFLHKTNCILVKPKMFKEIEDALLFLESNEETYSDIANNARLTVEENFSLDQSNISTLEIFKNFI